MAGVSIGLGTGTYISFPTEQAPAASARGRARKSPARRELEERITQELRRNRHRPFHVTYSQTNESLDAILETLRPTANDTVLAICGSGDQPFVLAERGARVYAIDNERAQIAYAQRRARLLRDGNISRFFSYGKTSFNKERADTLLDRRRLARIRKHIDRITFHRADFTEPGLLDKLRDGSRTYPTFTRMYLSNALTYDANERKILQDAPDTFRQLLGALSRGGLLYVTDPVKNLWRFRLAKDHERTRLANEKERELRATAGYGWSPTVYRRV